MECIAQMSRRLWAGGLRDGTKHGCERGYDTSGSETNYIFSQNPCDTVTLAEVKPTLDFLNVSQCL